MEKRIKQTLLTLEVGDITKYAVDAIVNAANASLAGGGGVDGAIHRAGGRAILRACQAIIAEIGSLQPGHAVITTGGGLPARNVIHTVGPIWREGASSPARILAMAYRSCLALADKMALHSLAFPSISTGAYGYPVAEAAAVALNTAKTYVEREQTGLEKIIFVLYSPGDYAVYRGTLENLTPGM
ncbi:macro domain-containing protein [candidate division FCPU426 bacterium]|nr:macro domain-containing protein [candidate division FCPU426 bacterium]